MTKLNIMLRIKTEIFGNSDNKWIEIDNDRITSVSNNSKPNNKKTNEQLILEIENSITFPGLINSHDHLEFSLFPKLGNKKYQDYVEWGEDIHKNNKEIIDSILKVPKDLRTEYGIYKNVLNGITTVVHHGKEFNIKNSIINVLSNYNYLHSVKLEKHWKLKLNLTYNSFPFVVHIGEGKNNESYYEINELLKWNLLKKPVVGVHGIMINETQARNFKALVWCPVSNYFLYGTTAAIDKLKKNTVILFGTDSNVSSDWNIWENLRFARSLNLLSDEELYDSITENPAKIWNLCETGTIKSGSKADLIIAKKKESNNTFDLFYKNNPEDILLILKDGMIIYFDKSLKIQLESKVKLKDYSEIKIKNSTKFIKGRLDNLCKSINTYNPEIKFPFIYS